MLKMASDGSSYVRVALGGKSVLIIIELKMVVATELQNVPMKDMIELLIYLLYVMEDNSLLKIWSFVRQQGVALSECEDE